MDPPDNLVMGSSYFDLIILFPKWTVPPLPLLSMFCEMLSPQTLVVLRPQRLLCYFSILGLRPHYFSSYL